MEHQPSDDEVGAIRGFFKDEETAVEEFFSPKVKQRALDEKTTAKPDHYKVVSISLYLEDIERLGNIVAQLKARGHSRANKSMVIREALRQMELNKFPLQR